MALTGDDGSDVFRATHALLPDVFEDLGYVLLGAVALDLNARLICDWRDGDVW